MVRFLRLTGFLVILFALWQVASTTFTEKSADDSMCRKELTIRCHKQGSIVSVPQYPYFPEAELAGSVTQPQLLTFLRVQRSMFTECAYSLKDRMDLLVQCIATLCLHSEKLHHTTYYRCQPMCEYYVFALRRILI